MNPVSMNANKPNHPQETPTRSALQNPGKGKSGKAGNDAAVSDKVTISETGLSDPDRAERLAEALSISIRTDPQAAVSALRKMEPANVENLLKGILEG